MIGTFQTRATDPLMAKNYVIFIFYTLKVSITILSYLEAKYENEYLILSFLFGSHNSRQEISSHFEQY